MGFAFKLPSVDFSDIAVDTVNFVDPIPCTDISLNQSVLTFESAEEQKTLIATPTPLDTTDRVEWVSDNENVATVTDGVVTIHGIGDATITAICGQCTASASISQAQLKAQYPITVVDGKYVSCFAVDGGQVLRQSSNASQHIVGQPYHDSNADLHYAGASGAATTAECVRVPYGATRAKIATTDNVGVSISYNYKVDRTELLTYSNTQFPTYISETTFVNTETGLAVEYGQAVIFRATDAQIPTLDYIYFT